MSTKYEHILSNAGNKLQVDSAIRDGNGVKIDTNYAKFTNGNLQAKDFIIEDDTLVSIQAVSVKESFAPLTNAVENHGIGTANWVLNLPWDADPTGKTKILIVEDPSSSQDISWYMISSTAITSTDIIGSTVKYITSSSEETEEESITVSADTVVPAGVDTCYYIVVDSMMPIIVVASAESTIPNPITGEGTITVPQGIGFFLWTNLYGESGAKAYCSGLQKGTVNKIDAQFIPEVIPSNMVTTDTNQTIEGVKTFSQNKLVTQTLVNPNGNVQVNLPSTAGTLALTSMYTYQSYAPSAAILDGGIHIVVLSSAPATKYSGYIYLIKEN